MTISRQSLVDRAYIRLTEKGYQCSFLRLDAMVQGAMTSMAMKVAVSPDEQLRNELRKDFSLSVGSGVASLTASLIATEPMIGSALQRAMITSADSSFPWQFIDYTILTLERPAFGLIYFGVKGTSLFCSDTTGVLGALTTTATANASYVPLVATISGKADLEELAIQELVSMGMNDAKAAA
jgi:hypothetical protein